MRPVITGESRLLLAAKSSPAPADLRTAPHALARALRPAGVPGAALRSRMAA